MAQPVGPRWWALVRDALLLLGGMGGVYHETVFNDGQRPALLAVYVSMMGLTALLRLDERRWTRGNGNGEDDSEVATKPVRKVPPKRSRTDDGGTRGGGTGNRRKVNKEDE